MPHKNFQDSYKVLHLSKLCGIMNLNAHFKIIPLITLPEAPMWKLTSGNTLKKGVITETRISHPVKYIGSPHFLRWPY